MGDNPKYVFGSIAGRGIQELFKIYEKEIERLIGEGVKIIYERDEDCENCKRRNFLYKIIRTSSVGSEDAKKEGKPYFIVGYFRLDGMVNCCGICVSTDTLILEKYRNKGVGQLLNYMKIDLARENGYTVLIATSTKNFHVSNHHIFQKNGWDTILEFNNINSGNIVCMYSYNLRDA